MRVKGADIYRSFKRKMANAMQISGSFVWDGMPIEELWCTAASRLSGEGTSNDSVISFDPVTDAVLNDEGYRAFSSEIHRTNSGTMVRGVLTLVERIQREKETPAGTVTPVMDGYEDFIEELPKMYYEETDPNFLDESLPKSVDTIPEATGSFASAAESYESTNTGETVAVPQARTSRCCELDETDSGQGSDSRNSETVDTANISDLISVLEGSSLSDESNGPSADNAGQNRWSADNAGQNRWSANIFRDLGNKLRSSLRKPKSSGNGSNKQQGTPRTPLNIEEYKNKYQDDAELEQLFQSLCNNESILRAKNSPLGELVEQIKTQMHVKKQLKKALAVGRSSAEFQCSGQLVEAERLLLLTSLRETAAKKELGKEFRNKIKNTSRKVDFVTLTNFQFPLCERAINDTLFDYFYVVVCSYKNQVHVTQAVRQHENRVHIMNSKITFHNLDEDYEIKVEIFALKMRKNSFYPNSPQKSKKSPLKKRLHHTVRKLSSRPRSPPIFDFDNEFSHFKSQGSLSFTSSTMQPSKSGVHQDSPHIYSSYHPITNNFQQTIRQHENHNVFLVENSKCLTLDELKYDSNMQGSLEMTIKTEVLLAKPDITGFLTVGEQKDGRLDWNRKWCKIAGFELEFYNYPQEGQGNIPTLVIDLKKCIQETVRLVERSTCSRPRTFRIEIHDGDETDDEIYTKIYRSQHIFEHVYHHRQPSCSIPKSYLLSVDTAQELNKWLSELNRLVSFLNMWRV